MHTEETSSAQEMMVVMVGARSLHNWVPADAALTDDIECMLRSVLSNIKSMDTIILYLNKTDIYYQHFN